MATVEQQGAIDYLVTKHGLPLYAAQGIVGGLSGESGTQLNTGARNKGDGKDGSDSVGIAQWNGKRATDGQRFLGKPLHEADGYEQLDYLVHELGTTESKALNIMKQADNAADVTRAFVKHYERPADENAGNVRVDRYLNPLLGVKATEGYQAPSTVSELTASEKLAAKYAADKIDDGREAEFQRRLDANQANYEAEMGKLKESTQLPTDTGNMFKDGFNDIYNTVQGAAAGLASGTENVGANILDLVGADTAAQDLKRESQLVEDVYNKKGQLDAFDVGYTTAEVAPALAVPVVGASATAGLATRAAYVAGNAIMQGTVAYATANPEDRAMSGGIAAGITTALPVIGKAYTTARSALPNIRAGSQLDSAGMNSTRLADINNTLLPTGVKPTLNAVSDIPYAPSERNITDLVSTARSQLNPNGNPFSIGAGAARQYDQTIANNVDATKAALNPTGMSSSALGEDIKSVGASNLNAARQSDSAFINERVNNPSLSVAEVDANQIRNGSAMGTDEAGQQIDINIGYINAAKPLAFDVPKNTFVPKVDEVMNNLQGKSVKQVYNEMSSLQDTFDGLKPNMKSMLTDYWDTAKLSTLNGIKEGVDNATGANIINDLYDVKAVQAQLKDLSGKKVNLKDTKSLLDLENTAINRTSASTARNTKGDNPFVQEINPDAEKILPTNTTKNFVGAKQSEKTFVGGKVKDNDYLNSTSSNAERELVGLDTPEIDNAVKMLAKDMNNKGFVDQKIVDDLSGKVGKTLDAITNTAIATGTVSAVLSGNIGYIIMGIAASGGKFYKPTIVKELYTKMVASHIVKAGVDPVYAEKLVSKYLKSKAGDAQLGKLTRKLSPIISQAIIQATDQ